MARIPLTNGFTLIPEGTHIFRIYDVEYDANFGKLIVHLINAQGITHIERFSLMKADGTMNEGACNAFSFFAKNALNDFSISEIDHDELVNHYIKANVIHKQSESTKEAGKMVTFANTEGYSPADGFDTEPCEKALNLGKPVAPAPNPAPVQPKGTVDLKSLLG